MSSSQPLYLDYNATTPVDPRVAAAMRPFLEEHFGNPSSNHFYGQITREAVEKARRQVATCIGARPEEIVFTSGGSESNNLAICGSLAAAGSPEPHIITSCFEHPAVEEVCRWLEKQGCRVTRVAVNRQGIVDPEDISRAIGPQTALITVMHANNEIGSIQPLAGIAAIARAKGVVLHSDAAQSIGKIPLQVAALGVDLLTIAGHKLYAPKGIGALFVRNGVQLQRQIQGAAHERGLRAGTENVLQIVGLGMACEIISGEGAAEQLRVSELRDRLWQGLSNRVPGLIRHGDPQRCLPNTLSVGFPGVTADRFLAGLPSIAASAGAACHSGDTRISATLRAIGLKEAVARGTIRLSIGRMTTPQEIDRAIGILAGDK